MPLYKSINVNSQTTVKVWKIEESYNDLIQSLNLKPQSLERVLGMKSELHQRGFLSVRHLLREFGYTDQDLYYDDRGKPHLKDGKHSSITHSFTPLISPLSIAMPYSNEVTLFVREASLLSADLSCP